MRPLFYVKRLLPGEKLSAKRTDEGRACLVALLRLNIGKPAPHPAFGHLPPKGEGMRYYSSSSSSKISCATSPRLRRVSIAPFSIRRWASVSVMPFFSIR